MKPDAPAITGVVPLAVPAAHLGRLLSGEGNLEAARSPVLAAAVGNQIAQFPPGTLLAFSGNFLVADELTITATPIRFGLVQAFSLRKPQGRWTAAPQLIDRNFLTCKKALQIERTQWLEALWLLTTNVKWRPARDGGFDLLEWQIPCAWEEWETNNLTWPQRACDLAKRLGVPPLGPNTLLTKCKRLGLKRVTK